MAKNADKEKADRTKRAYTLYIDVRVIERLEELGADPETDRSPSWLVNSILKEKLGLVGLDGKGVDE